MFVLKDFLLLLPVTASIIQTTAIIFNNVT